MFLCPLGSALLRPVTVGGSPWFEGAVIPLAAPGSPGQCLGLNPALCVSVGQSRPCLVSVPRVLGGCLCLGMAMTTQRILGPLKAERFL